MTDFDVDFSSIARAVTTRRSPFLGTLCRSPVTCTTCQELARSNLPTHTSEMRRVNRMFVNAIDITEIGQHYPVRVFMLPKSVFHQIISHFSYLIERYPDFNLFHPESGNDVIIHKEGMGIQTHYRAEIVRESNNIPNHIIYEQLMAGDKSSLHNLSELYLYFNDAGQLQQGSPIVSLKTHQNQIRILPPYNTLRLVHAEYFFHYTTVEHMQEREEADIDSPFDAIRLTMPRSGRTQSRTPNISSRPSTPPPPPPPRQGRELMLTEEVDTQFNGGGLDADTESEQQDGIVNTFGFDHDD